MPLYSLAQRTITNVANTAFWEIRTGAIPARLMEVGMTQNANAAGTFGFGRPSAIGVTPTSPQNFVAEADAGSPTSQTTACVAWGTAPATPINFERRTSIAQAVGAGLLWVFPRGIHIPASNSLVLWQFLASNVQDVWGLIDE